MRNSEICDYLIECFVYSDHVLTCRFMQRYVPFHATLRAVSKKGHFTKAFQIVPKNDLDRYWTHYEAFWRLLM